MKYVFYDVYWSSSAPKVANEVIDLLKRTSGSEMMKGYLPKYLATIKEMIDTANAKGRCAKLMISNKKDVRYTDHKVHGQISIYQDGKWGQKDVARIHFIEVNNFWTFDSGKENLVMRHFLNIKNRETKFMTGEEKEEILRGMFHDLDNGASVEEVADKYVTCATPELREKLIQGMKAIIEKGGES